MIPENSQELESLLDILKRFGVSDYEHDDFKLKFAPLYTPPDINKIAQYMNGVKEGINLDNPYAGFPNLKGFRTNDG